MTMADEFNKGFRRGYDTALQDLKVFLESGKVYKDLAESILRHVKGPDSKDIFFDVTGGETFSPNPRPDPLDGVCEPLESYAESRPTCSQCSCWDQFLKTIFCMKTYRRVSDCDIACDGFEPKIKGGK